MKHITNPVMYLMTIINSNETEGSIIDINLDVNESIIKTTETTFDNLEKTMDNRSMDDKSVENKNKK